MLPEVESASWRQASRRLASLFDGMFSGIPKPTCTKHDVFPGVMTIGVVTPGICFPASLSDRITMFRFPASFQLTSGSLPTGDVASFQAITMIGIGFPILSSNSSTCDKCVSCGVPTPDVGFKHLAHWHPGVRVSNMSSFSVVTKIAVNFLTWLMTFRG